MLLLLLLLLVMLLLLGLRLGERLPVAAVGQAAIQEGREIIREAKQRLRAHTNETIYLYTK